MTRMPVPVISVGNLSWGGNGKTPMVEYIARFLVDAGISPLILTRVCFDLSFFHRGIIYCICFSVVVVVFVIIDRFVFEHVFVLAPFAYEMRWILLG